MDWKIKRIEIGARNPCSHYGSMFLSISRPGARNQCMSQAPGLDNLGTEITITLPRGYKLLKT